MSTVFSKAKVQMLTNADRLLARSVHRNNIGDRQLNTVSRDSSLKMRTSARCLSMPFNKSYEAVKYVLRTLPIESFKDGNERAADDGLIQRHSSAHIGKRTLIKFINRAKSTQFIKQCFANF